MTIAEEFDDALTASEAALPGPELLPERLARATAHVLPVSGAGISLFFATGRRLPLGASDPMSARAERLQFTLGEGPCLSAHAEGQAVFGDGEELGAQWPTFYDLLVTRTEIRGVIALPLEDALRDVGALDLYVTPPDDVRAVSLVDGLTVTRKVQAALRGAFDQAPRRADGPPWLDAPAAGRRSRVWQAMGAMNVGLDVTSEDALAILRAHAYSTGVDVDDLAARLLTGEVPLEQLAPGHHTAG